MALTMLRLKQFAMPFALAALVSGGVVSPQINPAVAKSAAQNAAQTANASAAQSSSAAGKSSQTSATNPKNKMNTSATQTPAPHDKKPATPNTAVAADKKAATSAKTAAGQKTTSEKKPVASPAKTTQSQKTPPAKTGKQAGSVTVTTKPALPQGRRDPFVGLVGRQPGNGASIKLPPGKGGLQVGTIILQGIVSGPNGMIAVVANPQKSVYFLRVGDQLFDGRVDKIDISSVTFHEIGKDAFGKPVEREVTRMLNPSSGDQP